MQLGVEYVGSLDLRVDAVLAPRLLRVAAGPPVRPRRAAASRALSPPSPAGSPRQPPPARLRLVPAPVPVLSRGSGGGALGVARGAARRLVRADLHRRRGQPRPRGGFLRRGERGGRAAALVQARGAAGGAGGGERAGDPRGAGDAGGAVPRERGDGAAAVLLRVPRRRAADQRQQRAGPAVPGAAQRGRGA